jgi:hypothetical protein
MGFHRYIVYEKEVEGGVRCPRNYGDDFANFIRVLEKSQNEIVRQVSSQKKQKSLNKKYKYIQ